MDNNQSLINQFKTYLSKKKLSKKSVKNYVSDVRRFLKRAQYFTKSNQRPRTSFGKIFVPSCFSTYRSWLINSKTAIKTINRHLASLRQFGAFLVDSKLTTSNPTKGLNNFKTLASSTKANFWQSRKQKEKILKEFGQSLKKQRLSNKTITNYLSDVKQFLKFLNFKN